MLFVTLLVVVVLVTVNAFSPLKVSTRLRTALNADIVDTAVAAGTFKTLAAALTAADLVTALKGKGPFTVSILSNHIEK